jgi:hypothetical protein
MDVPVSCPAKRTPIVNLSKPTKSGNLLRISRLWFYWMKHPITTASPAVYAAHFSAVWTHLVVKAMNTGVSGSSIASNN